MIIRLLSNTFFILTFITSSGIFGYFGDLQCLEIPNFPNIRTLSLALGFNLRQLKQHSADQRRPRQGIVRAPLNARRSGKV